MCCYHELISQRPGCAVITPLDQTLYSKFVLLFITSHGQLGHSELTPEKEPRPVEALWGVPIDSVSTGGWHSACVSGESLKG